MYATILKMAWPYLQRFLASQAAEYLQKQREHRLGLSEDEEPPVDCSPCPPCPPTEESVITEIDASAITEPSSGSGIWFALSGILLGSAFSIVLYTILKDADLQLRD